MAKNSNKSASSDSRRRESSPPLPVSGAGSAAAGEEKSSSSSPVSPASPSPSSIVPALVELEELTEEEERERLFLERKVERSFYEAGKALKELRDKRLYRSTHRTFEEYCRDRFDHSRQKANFLIAGALVYDNLTTIGCQNLSTDNSTTNGAQILPTSERQVRPLTKLEPEEQVEAWHQAVEANEGKVPPARLVKDAVQRIRERHPVPNPWRVGDVCQIVVKENPELRGRGGQWCIVVEVHEFSSTVMAWDSSLQVRLENLKELPYSSDQQEFMRSLAQRLIWLPVDELEGPVRDFLASLGKLNRPFLTSLESKMLSLVEEQVELRTNNGNLLSRADVTHEVVK